MHRVHQRTTGRKHQGERVHCTLTCFYSGLDQESRSRLLRLAIRTQ